MLVCVCIHVLHYSAEVVAQEESFSNLVRGRGRRVCLPQPVRSLGDRVGTWTWGPGQSVSESVSLCGGGDMEIHNAVIAYVRTVDTMEK